MTTPGGTPGLPSGTVLTLENLESRVQDMTSSAMKGRAIEWFPDLANNTTGGNPASLLSPFGFLTDVWSRFNSTVANADPAAINSVDDLGDLFVEFVENLPVIGMFVRLAEAFLGQYDGDDEVLLTIQSLFGTIPKLLGGLLSGSMIPSLDASKIISGQFLTDLIPGLDVSKIVSGIFGGGFIPGLDASKIISGIFGTGNIPPLPASKVTSGTFLAGLIPGLDASKIVSGALGVGQVPALPADKITSGTFLAGLIPQLSATIISTGQFLAGQIPGLDASKITGGTFGDGFLPGLGAARDAIVQALTGGSGTGSTAAQVKTALTAIPGPNIATAVAPAVIPALDASKITSGSFLSNLIPDLDVSKIVSGVFGIGRIPALPASQISSGTFGAGLIPTLDASKIVSGSFPQSMLNITNIAANIVSGAFGAAQIPTLDASKITSGTFANGFIPGLGSLVTNLFGALTGNADPDATDSQTAAQLAELAATTAANSSAIAALQSTEDGTTNSGMSGGDEFARTVANGLGAGWETLYYDGTDGANGYWRVDGQQCVWVDAGANPRTSRHIRTDPLDMTTLSDYQKTTLVQGTTTSEDNAGFRILHRVNAARTQYVIAQVTSTTALMGYTVNGVAGETQFPGASSVGTTQAVGVSWTVESGTTGGVRVFRISRNGNPILTYADTGNLSQFGPNNRGWGWGGLAVNRNFGQGTPTAVTRVTIADNVPPTIAGSGFYVFRANTAAVSRAAGQDLALANNFLDQVRYVTPSFTWNPATSSLTVLKEGWYIFNMGVYLKGGGTDAGYNGLSAECTIRQNGTIQLRGLRMNSGGSGGTIPHIQGAFAPIYCQANDVIQPGMYANIAVNTRGEAAGHRTFFSGVRVGMSG